MFSQYSWWDFAKFCLALAIPYYAYVIWVYYRQDIREWISSRGVAPQPPSGPVDNDDEADTDSQSLYRVKTYGEAPAVKTEALTKESAPAYSAPSAAKQQVNEADLSDGHVIVDPATNGFDLAFVAEVEIPQERSLDDILETAKDLGVDEKGTVSPSNPSNEKAARLAQIVNSQQGGTVFADMPFKR